MRILVINNHSKHISQLLHLFSWHDVQCADFTEVDYSSIDVDLVILSWSYDHPWYSECFDTEVEYIRLTKTPVVGICMWCELLVRAYGGETIHLPQKIEEIISISSLHDEAKYNVYESHSYVITTLAPMLQGLYKSDYWWEIISHRDKKHRGIQFHPEVEQPTNDGRALFQKVVLGCICA